MKTRFRVVGLLASAALAAATLTGCSSSNELIIATDLPLQGSSFDSNNSTNKAIELYLKQQDYKAGDYKVKLKIIVKLEQTHQQHKMILPYYKTLKNIHKVLLQVLVQIDVPILVVGHHYLVLMTKLYKKQIQIY